MDLIELVARLQRIREDIEKTKFEGSVCNNITDLTRALGFVQPYDETTVNNAIFVIDIICKNHYTIITKLIEKKFSSPHIKFTINFDKNGKISQRTVSCLAELEKSIEDILGKIKRFNNPDNFTK